MCNLVEEMKATCHGQPQINGPVPSAVDTMQLHWECDPELWQFVDFQEATEEELAGATGASVQMTAKEAPAVTERSTPAALMRLLRLLLLGYQSSLEEFYVTVRETAERTLETSYEETAAEEASFSQSGLAGDKFKDLDGIQKRDQSEAKLQMEDPRADRYMQDWS
eukprot:s1704_g7.t1